MLEELKMKKVPGVLTKSNIVDFTLSPESVAGLDSLTTKEKKDREDYLYKFADTFCDKVCLE